jgi:hypothetical protein
MSLGMKERSEGNGKILIMGEEVRGCGGEANSKVTLQEKIKLSVGSDKIGMENEKNQEQEN